MYSSQNPREPSGCMQTWIITITIYKILLIPALIIGASLGALGFTLYLFTQSFYLGLLVVAVIAAGVWLFTRWEAAREKKRLEEK